MKNNIRGYKINNVAKHIKMLFASNIKHITLMYNYLFRPPSSYSCNTIFKIYIFYYYTNIENVF